MKRQSVLRLTRKQAPAMSIIPQLASVFCSLLFITRRLVRTEPEEQTVKVWTQEEEPLKQ